MVFVHGVLGGTDTWRNSDTRDYWPAMILEDEVFNGTAEEAYPKADVFVFEYPSRPDNGFTIQEAASIMSRVLR